MQRSDAALAFTQQRLQHLFTRVLVESYSLTEANGLASARQAENY